MAPMPRLTHKSEGDKVLLQSGEEGLQHSLLDSGSCKSTLGGSTPMMFKTCTGMVPFQ